MRAHAALADRRVLRRYLLDGEHVITAVHQHWGKVAEPVLSALLSLVVVLWLDTVVPAAIGLLATVLWWAWLVVLGRMVWRLLEWRHDWFVATDKRLLLTYGLITQKVAMMPLKKVTDMTYNRSPVGRVLGYGTFVMESAGQDQALHRISFIPEPDHTYRSICAEIFGVDDRDRVLTEPFLDEDDRFDDDGGVPDPGWPPQGDRVPGGWHSVEEAHRSIGQEPSRPIPVRSERRAGDPGGEPVDPADPGPGGPGGPGGPDANGAGSPAPGSGGSTGRGRSLYRSPDLQAGDDRRDPLAEPDEDETGPIPRPPWPPEEGL